MTRRSLIVLASLCAAGPLAAQRADTLRLPLRWEVTEGEQAVAESLGVLSGIAVDKNGNTYVSDRANARIWIFDANGRSQRGTGRKGRGPGEFQSPTGIAVGPDGMLWVRDINGVTRFAADPASGRLSRYVSSFNGPPMADWMSDRASRFTSSGGFIFPQFHVIPNGTPVRHGQYLVYSESGRLIDSLDVPPFADAPRSYARVMISANSGRMLPGLGHVPFAPLPAWDITPRGTLLWGDAKTYVIRELDRSGKLVREFTRAVSPDRIPAAERRDSTAALRARVDSLQYPRAQVQGSSPDVWALKLPETYPAYMAVYAGVDGRIWVRRWAPNGQDRSVFDVFEADGRFRTTVVVPRNIATEPTPVLSLDGIAAIGVDRETGAFTILRFGGIPR